MGKAEVLALLREEEYVSGEEISRALGVSRAAVWKAIDALRDDGCRIDSAPNRGYRLRVRALSEELVRAALGDCPWSVRVLDETDSTNNVLKRECTAPHGTVIITDGENEDPVVIEQLDDHNFKAKGKSGKTYSFKLQEQKSKRLRNKG